MNKKIICFCFTFILCFTSAFGVGAIGELPTFGNEIPSERTVDLFEDYSETFSDEEIREFNKLLEEYSKSYNMELAVLFVNSDELDDIITFSNDYYDYNGIGCSDGRDGAVLVMNLHPDFRDWWLSGYGLGADVFGGIEDYAFSTALPYFGEDDYYNGVISFIDQCSDIAEYYSNHGTAYPEASDIFDYEDDYYYTDTVDEYFHHNIHARSFDLKDVLICYLIAFLVSFIIIKVMAGKLKSVKANPAADNYIRQNSFVLSRQQDVYLYSRVSKTPRPKDNNNNMHSGGSARSGGSMHMGSSGSSHSGGGGKF